MEYITAKTINQNSEGLIALSSSVFESIAVATVEELTTAKIAPSATQFKKGVNCKVENANVVFTLDLLVKAGKNINSVCENVQQQIKNNVESMTSIKKVVVDINVKGFYI